MANQSIRFKGLVGSSYTLQNYNYESQRTINRYVEYSESGFGKDAEPAQLVPTPGLDLLVSGLNGPARGAWVAKLTADGSSHCYRVHGTTLYEIHGVSGSISGWSATAIGTVNGTGHVNMTDNGITLFIVDPVTGDVYGNDIATNVITKLTGTGNWQLATSCTYMDGYIVFTQLNSNQFFWTDLYSTNVSGLNFAAGETNPDTNIQVLSNNEDLWLACQSVIELWYDAGTGNTTFARRQGILIETGLASPNTMKKLNSSIFWLATDERGGPVVYRANGYQPVRVSTFAVEQAMSQASSDQIAGATADVYQINGHFFYQINIPGLSSTWVFDDTSYQQSGMKPQWHEKQSGYGLAATQHMAVEHCYYKGFHLIGDNTYGNIYFFNPFSNRENGQLVMRTRTTPHVSDGLRRIRYNSIQIDCTVGSITDENVTPLMLLQTSNDGGKTWSNVRTKSLGKTGETRTRVVFYQLGVSKNRVFRLMDCNDAYMAYSGANLNMDLGIN